MLRKFKITIDGKEYLVEMEEIGGTPTTAPVVAQTVAAPEPVATAPTPVAESVSQATATPADAEEAMKAPMPGTIIKMLVAPGDAVTENQPLLVLEAMKMENEIVANKAGTVGQIFVNKNDTVNAGDALIQIN
ncbi:acetyl-CoA carboxylase biotin carboxyl carrier protein subunit [Lactiplantibacillus herbarum]|uniref:acetyl-CoA carboxylase biotin carboxyl carrier protein subunit n=1 Tax=Lactiplantibacillus herbarum TaxID=1670446 RepID=UPI00064FBB49|nr:acetyl-CoA carboxylase biotin carboxyl carrier protein subunit [Lactiplantibacillus herbarum]